MIRNEIAFLDHDDVMAIRNKKILAKDLYVKQGFTGKATAIAVMVNEKTMTSWVRKYNWKALREAELKKIISPEVVTPNLQLEVLKGFKSHVKKSNKYLAKKLDQFIEDYLTTDNSNS